MLVTFMSHDLEVEVAGEPEAQLETWLLLMRRPNGVWVELKSFLHNKPGNIRWRTAPWTARISSTSAATCPAVMAAWTCGDVK